MALKKGHFNIYLYCFRLEHSKVHNILPPYFEAYRNPWSVSVFLFIQSAENDDIIVTSVLVTCISNWQIYWKSVLYAMYGILFIFGAFLAWETRNVKIPALNDSKLIGKIFLK